MVTRRRMNRLIWNRLAPEFYADVNFKLGLQVEWMHIAVKCHTPYLNCQNPTMVGFIWTIDHDHDQKQLAFPLKAKKIRHLTKGGRMFRFLSLAVLSLAAFGQLTLRTLRLKTWKKTCFFMMPYIPILNDIIFGETPKTTMLTRIRNISQRILKAKGSKYLFRCILYKVSIWHLQCISCIKYN